jgi:hypothetical protein
MHHHRRHIIHSLDLLLYQLHTLSFFLSPSLSSYICRLIAQLQTSKPRDLDSTRSLRFFVLLVLLFNASSVWSHATKGAGEGKALVLDFIGLAQAPSRLQLLFLDAVIIFLQILLTTIAYETSLSNDAPDSLLSIPPTSSLPSTDRITRYPPTDESPYVLDLHLVPILNRLKNPPLVAISATPQPRFRTSLISVPPALRGLMRNRLFTRQHGVAANNTSHGASV